MSVQTQIDRISGNITAALSAIAEKGVTVPDGSNSDALAGLIQAIQAGGGNVKLTNGSVIFADQLVIGNKLETAYTFEHGLGVKPDMFVFAYEGNSAYNDRNHLKLFSAVRDIRGSYHYFSSAGASPPTSSSSNLGGTQYAADFFSTILVTENMATIVGSTASTFLCEGYGSRQYGYVWVAVKYGE